MENLENYEKFLEIIDSDLQKIFYNQREYIYCKEGCSLCCERGDYPLSKIEYDYMTIQYNQLNEDIKNIIKSNIERIEDKDSYVCPFLIEHKCSIYSHRPIVCRTFGVLTEDAKGLPSFPFCASMGLNYSKVYDEEKKHLSNELAKEKMVYAMPHIFRLSNKVVTNLPLAKKLNINFGEQKRLIDFLTE